LEYDAIPGDMRNASSYWAGATNGDGNRRITQDADFADTLNNENIKFFEHLSRAKLVPEVYTNTWAINVGYPALKLNSGKGMIAGGLIRGSPGAEDMQLSSSEALLKRVASIYLEVSHPTAVGSSTYNGSLGAASPKTIASIDTKIDDGVARTGKFQGYMTYGSTVGFCLTAVGGDYRLTETGESCNAEFVIAK
jgi:hypothetical protein